MCVRARARVCMHVRARARVCVCVCVCVCARACTTHTQQAYIERKRDINFAFCVAPVFMFY